MKLRNQIAARARGMIAAKEQWANLYAGRLVKFSGGTWMITNEYNTVVNLTPSPGVIAQLPADGLFKWMSSGAQYTFTSSTKIDTDETNNTIPFSPALVGHGS